MNPIAKTVIGTLIAASIIANASLLFSFNERLARIEQILSPVPHVQFSTK